MYCAFVIRKFNFTRIKHISDFYIQFCIIVCRMSETNCHIDCEKQTQFMHVMHSVAEWYTLTMFEATVCGRRNFFYVKGSHRPRPLTRLRRSLIDKTPPITLIRTRRMRNDELVCIMAVGDRWRSAYSQIAYGKLCARLFNYLIWWVRVMVEGWGFG